MRIEILIPTNEECFLLMEKYQMLDHIKAHSLVVANVAGLLSKSLLNAGVSISIKKVIAGALLHDIGKTPSLKSGHDHSELGRQICLDNNLEELADIVGEHVRLKNYELNCSYSEKEIVFYSDKRVNHDKIVSLEERLAYILERYGKDDEERCRAIKTNFAHCRKVEKKLFGKLMLSAERVAELARNEIAKLKE